MNNADKTSKVAICERCQSFVLASDVNHITKSAEKDFTFFTNNGFTVKLESKDETRARKYSWWEDCKNGLCNSLENK